MQTKGIVVIRVERSEGGRWHVLESDFEDPLAAFDDRQSACDYATRLSAARDGATVVMLDDTRQGKVARMLGESVPPMR